MKITISTATCRASAVRHCERTTTKSSGRNGGTEASTQRLRNGVSTKTTDVMRQRCRWQGQGALSPHRATELQTLWNSSQLSAPETPLERTLSITVDLSKVCNSGVSMTNPGVIWATRLLLLTVQLGHVCVIP
jgi:hypothetical protein